MWSCAGWRLGGSTWWEGEVGGLSELEEGCHGHLDCKDRADVDGEAVLEDSRYSSKVNESMFDEGKDRLLPRWTWYQ